MSQIRKSFQLFVLLIILPLQAEASDILTASEAGDLDAVRELVEADPDRVRRRHGGDFALGAYVNDRAFAAFFRELEASSPEEAKKAVIDTICRMPPAHPWRSKTAYSDPAYILLGDMIERVTGQPLEIELAHTQPVLELARLHDCEHALLVQLSRDQLRGDPSRVWIYGQILKRQHRNLRLSV